MFDHDTRPPAGQAPTQADAASAAGGLADLGFLAGKWKWEFLGVLGLVLVAALGYMALVRAPVFESEARLFVRVSPEQAPPPTIRTREGVTFMPSTRSDVLSEIDLLLNGELFERVIDAARLEELVQMPPPPPATPLQALRRRIAEPVDWLRDRFDDALVLAGLRNRLSLREALLRQLERAVVIANTRELSVIVVKMRWGDRAVPQPLLQHYLEAFLASRLEMSAPEEAAYFAGQLAEAGAEIDRITARQQALRERGIHALGEQRSVLIGALAAARSDLEALDAEARVVAQRMAVLSAEPDAGVRLTLANLPDHPLLTALDQAAISLMTQLERAAAAGQLRAGESDALQRQLSLVRAATLGALGDHAATLAVRRDAEAGRIADLEAQLAGLAELEAEWRATERDLAVVERSYRHFAERLDEARERDALRALQIGNVLLLQPPSAPRFAADVRNARLMAVIGVFGVLLALVWVSAREMLDRRVYRARDVEAVTGSRPLAVLPRRGGAAGEAALGIAAARLRVLLRTDDGAVPGALAVAPLAVPVPGFADEMRGLARALRRQGLSRVLLVNLQAWTPGAEGLPDGATADAEGLRARLPEGARLGVDADGVHHMTLTDATAAEAVLAMIERAPAELSAGYDAVLVATPPLAGSPLALRAAAGLGQLVLRLGAGRDRRDLLAAMLQGLPPGAVRVLGTLLADWRGHGPAEPEGMAP